MTAFKTVIFDFQNTLYEEIFEYGPAIEAAIDVWKNASPSLDTESLFTQMSSGFSSLGSDWDMRVWDLCPSLSRLENFENLKRQATLAFEKCSLIKTLENGYDGLYRTLQTLKERGLSLGITTEAVTHAAADRIHWLGIDKYFDHIFAWPGTDQYVRNLFCPLSSFPLKENSFLKKPHAAVIGAALSGIYKQPFDTLFHLEKNEEWVLHDFPSDHEIQDAASMKLLPLNDRASELIGQTLYVGDSLYKDGMMARNAGVSFAYAGYGKVIPEGMQTSHEQYRDLLYAVSGWDKDMIRLTHEAQKLADLDSIPRIATLRGLPDLLEICT